MIQILLFVDTDCNSCGQAEEELEKLQSRRENIEIVIFRRPDDIDRFREYNVAICPAVFVEERFISYGLPDISKIESLLDASGKGLQTMHTKTKLKGESR